MRRPGLPALVLIALGIALGAGAGVVLLRVARENPAGSESIACQPAPGEWLMLTRALLHDYREPCDSFYWLPEPDGEFHVRVTFNNYGLRGPDYALTKPDGVYRVLVVGDSFAQGMQVEAEQGFPWLLAGQLSAGGRPVEVINLSVDAYGTDRELLLYSLLGRQFRPDLVLLALYAGNDVQDNQIELEARRYGYRLERAFFTLAGDALRLHNSPIFSPDLYPDAPAFAWLADQQRDQQPQPEPHPPERPVVIQSAPDYQLEYPVELGVYLPEDDPWREAWALTEALLRVFRDQAAAEGSQFAVVIIPDRRGVHGDDWAATLATYGDVRPELRQADPTAPSTRLERLLLRLNVPVLDLTWTLRSWAASHADERLYYPGDGHFNPNGHAVSAGRIASWLRGLVLTLG